MRRHRRSVFASMALLIVASIVAPGQEAPARVPAVSGVVFDSVARRPLAGAVVELANARDPAAVVPHPVWSDSLGRYEFYDVAAGRYLIGFSHPVLDSLSLEPPAKALDIGAEPLRLDFGVPSLSTIARAFCPTTYDRDSTLTLLGHLYDAESRAGAGGAAVSVSWQELIVGGDGLRKRQPRTTAVTRADGGFAFCGVPANVEIGLVAVRDRDTTDLVELRAPGRSVMRRALFVGTMAAPTDDSAMARGTTVRGHVRTRGGRALAGVSINVASGNSTTRSNEDGSFELRSSAAGTRRVEFRSLGYAPERRVVDLRAGESLSIDVTMLTVQQVMDTVRIVAQRVYDTDSKGFESRRKSGMGYYFGADDIAKNPPTNVSDLFRRVPSIIISEEGPERLILMRGFYHNDFCRPIVYIDGMRLVDLDARDIDGWVKPGQLTGLEVYTSAERAPMQFSMLDGCGSIVLWTRVESRRAKKPS